jgi:acetyltransferase-like isoleucine patch superfamily enzyme
LSTEGVHLGNKVTIREFAWVQLTSKLDNPGCRISIGDNTYIGPRSYIGAAAKIEIGQNCQLGGNVSLIAESHKFSDHSAIYEQGVTRKGIKIGNDCWIGNNSIILDGVELGESVVVGAGSVVTKSFSSNTVIAGVPAKEIKKRNEI